MSEETAARIHPRFLRGLTHEMRTPLGSILILTELLTEGPEAVTGVGLENVLKIRQATSDLRGLIEQVATLVRTLDGRLAAVPKAFALEALVVEIDEEHSEPAAAKGLALEVERRGDLPSSVESDRGILRRVLDGLLEHALAVTPEGRILFRVSADPGGGVVFEVRHGGPPIPEEQRETIFEPFPAGPSRTRRLRGAGALTLPVAKALSDLLQAQLTIGVAGGGNVLRLSLPPRL